MHGLPTSARSRAAYGAVVLEISLKGLDGSPFTIESHPEFLDYVVRDSGRSSETVVGVHDDNLVAPILAALHEKHALSSYPDLARAKGEVAAAFPAREDGLRILELLLPWAQRFPDGRWSIAGADRVPRTRFIATATEPRFSARSLSVDPLAYGFEFIGEADRMDDTEGVDLEPLERDTMSGAALLQRETRIKPTSHSRKGRSRSERPRRRETTRVENDFDVHPPTAVVRVAAVVKEAIAHDPRTKEMIATLSRALLNGADYAKTSALLRALPGETS